MSAEAKAMEEQLEQQRQAELQEQEEEQGQEQEQEQEQGKEEEQEQEQGQEEEQNKEKEKHWAIDAMHEERERRKEIQRQMDEQRKQIDRMESTFQRLMEQRKQEKIPAFEENPGEHLKARLEEVDRTVKDLNLSKAEQQRQREMMTEHQRFVSGFETIETQYATKQKDYYDAVGYLRDARIKEYQIAGYSPSDAAHLAQQEALSIAWNATQSGKNGAEVFYSLAKQRGFKPPVQQKSEIDKLKELEKNIKSSKTLGPSGGKDGDLTLAQLAEMSEDEFDKATAGDNWRKLMGG